MAQVWSERVNTDFYGQDGGWSDNTEKVEFKSGRTIKYLKNSVPRRTHSVMLRCADKGTEKTVGRTEFEWFLHWYENVIKSGALSFYLPDVVTGSGVKEYTLSEPPSWSGQKYKEVSLSLEEV